MGIEELKGKTLAEIEVSTGGTDRDDRLTFITTEGERYVMFHSQDCCETVELKEVIGEFNDLIGSPILEAEEVTNDEGEPKPEYAESWTWTFYKLGTIKGHVTLRWLGESNGYYSEDVSIEKVEASA